ncbi:MAG: hypothetical protein AAFY20_26505 [Cyanobacteria bacterium J06639_14]
MRSPTYETRFPALLCAKNEADHNSVDRYAIRLVLERQSDRISQHWQTPHEAVSAIGQLRGSAIVFDQAERSMQLLLLRDGGSSTTNPCGAAFLLRSGLVAGTGTVSARNSQP